MIEMMSDEEKERRRKRRAERYADPEIRQKLLAKARAWKKNNPDKVRAYKRQDYERHKEQYQVANRARYQRDKEIVAARSKLARQDPEMRKKNQERVRAYRLAHPDHMKKYRIRHREQNRASAMWSGSKKSAKEKGVAFDLDKQWFKDRLQCGVCEMSGLPFDMKGKRVPNGPSIDRIDPTGGYTKDNCRLILWWLNRAKTNLSDEYCLAVFRAVFIKRGEIVPDKSEIAA